MPKVRKQRTSILDRVPRDTADGENKPYRGKTDGARGPGSKGPATKKPAPRKSANRRVRQTSDLAAQAPKMQKKSDRNRGRG
jgi:23S rRNA pseudouridine2605 synthase